MSTVGLFSRTTAGFLCRVALSGFIALTGAMSAGASDRGSSRQHAEIRPDQGAGLFRPFRFGGRPEPDQSPQALPPGCTENDQPLVYRARISEISYCGPISEEGVILFRNLLDQSVQRLTIASRGGDTDAPLMLAELVRDSGLELQVDGPCFSGCASFVFVAAERRRVTRNALLGVHNTANSAAFVVMAGRGGTGRNDAPLLERARRERELYRRAGVSQDLLMEPQARIGPVCFSVGLRHPRTGETTYNITTRDAIWVPSAEQWRSFGVSFAGSTPQRAEDIEFLIRTQLPAMAEGLTTVVDPSPVPSAWWMALLSVPECTGQGKRTG